MNLKNQWHVTFCCGVYLETTSPCKYCNLISNKIMSYQEAKVFSNAINKLKGIYK